MLCKSFRTRPTGNCRLGSREFNPGPRAPENLGKPADFRARKPGLCASKNPGLYGLENRRVYPGKLKLLNYEIASDTAAVYMPGAIKSEMAIFECNGRLCVAAFFSSYTLKIYSQSAHKPGFTGLKIGGFRPTRVFGCPVCIP